MLADKHTNHDSEEDLNSSSSTVEITVIILVLCHCSTGRMHDCEAKVLLTASGVMRGNKKIDLKAIADSGLDMCTKQGTAQKSQGACTCHCIHALFEGRLSSACLDRMPDACDRVLSAYLATH